MTKELLEGEGLTKEAKQALFKELSYQRIHRIFMIIWALIMLLSYLK